MRKPRPGPCVAGGRLGRGSPIRADSECFRIAGAHSAEQSVVSVGGKRPFDPNIMILLYMAFAFHHAPIDTYTANGHKLPTFNKAAVLLQWPAGNPKPFRV